MWSTKSNSITESKLSLYTIEECTHFSSFDSTKIEEDSNSQQCKTTKCCNMDSFIFQSILTSNDEGKQKNNSRRNSCSPAFHYKRKISIIDQKESIPLRANGSAKTLSNFTPKPHASNTFSASAINHLSSVLSYYDSTREYLLKEMKSTESSTPQNGYNFIKRDRNKCDSFKSNSCSSNKFNYPPSRNAYFNNQPMIKSSPMLYMTMAQFNYAKYCQDYYSKMRQYIANKENKLSQFAPGDMIDANSESNRQIEIEDSKHQTDSLSFSMHGKNGWVCGQCNNFNFETWHMCNRCGLCLHYKIPMSTKKNLHQKDYNIKVHKKLNERKGDWICVECKNLNFAFRTECNRCHISKKEGCAKTMI